jgi:hypothetical protein
MTSQERCRPVHTTGYTISCGFNTKGITLLFDILVSRDDTAGLGGTI